MSTLSLFGVPYGVTTSSPDSGAGEPDHRLPVPSLRDDLHTAKQSLYVPKYANM
jgi:hypothetical protein